MNQPSEQALRNMIRFLLKTSVPRILAEKEKEAAEKEAAINKELQNRTENK